MLWVLLAPLRAPWLLHAHLAVGCQLAGPRAPRLARAGGAPGDARIFDVACFDGAVPAGNDARQCAARFPNRTSAQRRGMPQLHRNTGGGAFSGGLGLRLCLRGESPGVEEPICGCGVPLHGPCSRGGEHTRHGVEERRGSYGECGPPGGYRPCVGLVMFITTAHVAPGLRMHVHVASCQVQ